MALRTASVQKMARPKGVGAVSYTHLDVYKRQQKRNISWWTAWGGHQAERSMPMLDKLAAVEARYSQIEARLAAPETYDDPAQVRCV